MPCEENCYAYCLADRIDVRRFEASWLEGLRHRSAALAAEVAATAAAAAGAAAHVCAPKVSPPDASGRMRGRRPAPGRDDGVPSAHRTGEASQSRNFEWQVVKFTKDIWLLKVDRKDCFVFNIGCLVCWGCTPVEAAFAKDKLRPFLVEPLSPQDVEEDHLLIVETGDVVPEVRLSTRDPPTFERVALAYALAQSVRLGSLELRIDRSIAQTRSIPEKMAQAGQVSKSSRQVTKMVGELFVLKSQVNLHTDILETPEFFWEYSDYEGLYETARSHLDLDRRVKVLNHRFEVLQDLFYVLETELTERSKSRLSWVVILLCAMEGAVMALRLVTRLHRAEGEDVRPVIPIVGSLLYACRALTKCVTQLWQL